MNMLLVFRNSVSHGYSILFVRTKFISHGYNILYMFLNSIFRRYKIINCGWFFKAAHKTLFSLWFMECMTNVVQDSSSSAVSSDETKQKFKGHWGCQVSLSSSVNSVLACCNIKRYIDLTDSGARDFLQALYGYYIDLRHARFLSQSYQFIFN
jgi:hypothetical protein